ncbi:MAG TPA: hypothetical protein VF165_02460 [Nocardioidaceae bacterium]
MEAIARVVQTLSAALLGGQLPGMAPTVLVPARPIRTQAIRTLA